MTDQIDGMRQVRRNGIVVWEPLPDAFEPTVCELCGNPTPGQLCGRCRRVIRTERRHGDHAGFNQHIRHAERPCDACAQGESAYQHERYLRRNKPAKGAI